MSKTILKPDKDLEIMYSSLSLISSWADSTYVHHLAYLTISIQKASTVTLLIRCWYWHCVILFCSLLLDGYVLVTAAVSLPHALTVPFRLLICTKYLFGIDKRSNKMISFTVWKHHFHIIASLSDFNQERIPLQSLYVDIGIKCFPHTDVPVLGARDFSVSP